MSGTHSGGLKCAATNMELHGKDFYRIIGAKGGKASSTGGFYANPSLAQKAGRIGGLKSRRGKSLKTTQRVNHAKEMRDNGATLKEIAEALDVTVSTICSYLREN